MCGNAQVSMLCSILATANSGLWPLLWTDWLLDVLVQLGVASDWLFQIPEGAQRTMTSFQEQFYDHLLEYMPCRTAP
jgi:hypothetical protein